MDKTIPNPKHQPITDPKTLGDKIKKRRCELQLLQKDVAKLMGVDVMTIGNWEGNRSQPTVSSYPKIIEFLGYFPFEVDTNTLAGKIKEYRFRRGVSQEGLANRLGVNESTIFHFEKGRHKLMGKRLEFIVELLNNEKD